MALSRNNKTVQKHPEVKFRIEIRPCTNMQLEAGKRLFSKLVATAQLSLQTSNESKQIDTKT